ncbi:MAG: ABC transporter permease [Thermomicrobiales bacterium]
MAARLVRLLGRYLTLGAGLVLLNFLIPRLLPGDPLTFSSGEGLDAATPLSAAARAQLRSYYHLDDPLRRQFGAYLGGLARGDLGCSIDRSAPVASLIGDRPPWTVGLLFFSFGIAAVLGVAAGVAAGWAAGGPRDRLLTSVAGVFAAIPEFLVAIGLLLVFAVGLRWFPLYGGKTSFADYGGGPAAFARRTLDVVRHLTLPAAALVATNASAFLLLARDASSGLRREPWLDVARAKGLTEREVVRAHALPNMARPLLSFAGLRFGTILGGALVVERVFGVPGLGLLGYQAIRARDYPVLQALFLLSGIGVLAANLVVDLLHLHLERRRGLLDG